MFGKYEILNVSEVIDLLSPLGVDGPSVKFLLSYGHTVEGQIIKNQKNMILVQSGSDLAYLSQQSILSVIVSQADRYPKILTQGAVARNPGDNFPSRLELKRKLKASAMDVDWNRVKGLDEDTVNIHVEELMQALITAAAAIGADEMGRTALKEIENIHILHQPNETLKISKNKKVLVIETDLIKQHPKDIHQKLQLKISSVL